MIVVSDTSVINYLVEIGQIQVLARMHQQVLLPGAVRRELSAANSPAKVNAWIQNPPEWVAIKEIDVAFAVRDLGPGEAEAISLAIAEHCPVLMDEHAGRQRAQILGLEVVGVIGILQRAAYMDLIDFESSIASLRDTGFYVSDVVIERAREALLKARRNKS